MKALYKIIAPILTALLWIGLILFTTVTISIIMGGDGSVDTTTAISVIVALLTTIIWTPRGVQLGEENPRTIRITKLYNHRAGYIVNKQMFKEMSDFCDYKNEEKRVQIIKEILAERQIEYGDYLTYKAIADKTSELTHDEQQLFLLRFKEKNEKGEFVLTAKGKFLKKFIKKKIRFQKLEPKHLIQSHNSSSSLVPKNREYLTRNFNLIIKVFWGIIIGVLTGAFILQQKSVGIEEFIKMIIWTCGIIGNLFTSIRVGNTSVCVYRCAYLIEKTDYTAEFFKFCNISVETVDQDLKLD